MEQATRQTVRALAASAGRRTQDVIRALRDAGLEVGVGSHVLDGEALVRAKGALGVRRQWIIPEGETKLLDEADLMLRMLRKLRAKGKCGRTHHTEISNLFRGVPDNQKHMAKEIAETMLRDGLLAEKRSVGQRHVWLTSAGLARLSDLK